MWLQQAAFGTQVDTARGPRVTRPVNATPVDTRGQVYVVTAIYAPQGLHDRVRHVWYHGPREIKRTRYYDVDFGRDDGYRLWSPVSLTADLAGQPLRVDVETEGGQLIGRAWLPGRQ